MLEYWKKAYNGLKTDWELVAEKSINWMKSRISTMKLSIDINDVLSAARVFLHK